MAAVVDAKETRPVPVFAQDATEGETRVATCGAVAEGLEEAPGGRRTTQVDVGRQTARPPPPARLGP